MARTFTKLKPATLQQVERPPAATENLTRQETLNPVQIPRISQICQERKIKSLDLLECQPEFHEEIVEFQPEGIDTCSALPRLDRGAGNRTRRLRRTNQPLDARAARPTET